MNKRNNLDLNLDQLIIRNLAEKHELPEFMVRNAVHTWFKTVVETMRKGDYESVFLPYIGKFYVSPYNRDKFTKINETRIQRLAEEGQGDLSRVQELDMEERSNREISKEEIKSV